MSHPVSHPNEAVAEAACKAVSHWREARRERVEDVGGDPKRALPIVRVVEKGNLRNVGSWTMGSQACAPQSPRGRVRIEIASRWR